MTETLLKLVLAPEKAGYSGEFGNEVVSTNLPGGPSRQRRDQIGASDLVSVSWVASDAEYRYLQAFFRGTGAGSRPFKIDLVLDSEELTEYEARLVPGSWRLDEFRGKSYTVKAQLELTPQPDREDLDLAVITVATAFSPRECAAVLDIETLVNVTAPAATVLP